MRGHSKLIHIAAGMLLSAVICLVIAGAALIPLFQADGGFLCFRETLANQTIPAMMQMHRMLKDGEGLWCWNAELGTQLIGGFARYGLGSPFFLATLPADPAMLPYLTGPLYLLKLAAAGVTAWLFIRMFTENRISALAGAVMYAFSGYQCLNITRFEYLDMVALFPLMMVGAELILRGRNKWVFSFAVFLNCFANYHFFIGEVVFTSIWFMFRLFRKCGREKFFELSMRFICATMTGVGMAAVIFLPSMLFVLSNPRSGETLPLARMLLSPGHLATVLKGFLIPCDTMTQGCAVYETDYSSAAAYLPMAGCSMTFAYILKRRDRISGFLALMALMAVVPAFGALFYLFTWEYKRWLYMLVLVMAMVTASVLEKPERFPVLKGALINLGLMGLLTVSMKLPFHGKNLPLDPKTYYTNILGAAAALAVLLILLKIRKGRAVLILLCTAGISCAMLNWNSRRYLAQAEDPANCLRMYQVGAELHTQNEAYRYNLGDNRLTYPGEAAGIYSRSETVSPSTFYFDRLLGFARTDRGATGEQYHGLPEMLGAKYYVSSEPVQGRSTVQEVTAGGKTNYVTERGACPIGFAYKTYITEGELQKLPKEKRGIAVLGNMILKDNQVWSLRKCVTHNTKPEREDNASTISWYVKAASESAVKDFHRNSAGFTCTTDWDTERAAFFTVPFESGWSAEVDGEPAEILRVAGMMALHLTEGPHTIAFRYHVPGLRLGIILSIISLLVFAKDIRKSRRNRGQKK